MKKPLKLCVNGDGRPVSPPSWVLCKECLAELDQKMQALCARRSPACDAHELREGSMNDLHACQRCGRAPGASWVLWDYCAGCGQPLCDACIAEGCCGRVPARSGITAEPVP